MLFYLKPTFIDAQKLNDILYHRYVTEDGINFKFPYDEQTTEFIDYNAPVFIINDTVINAVNDEQIPVLDRDFIIAILLFKKTEAEAKAAGWVTGND